ncbi:restriction endonuclease subunit S [Ferrovum sp.]|uniref:restriction endonuclease subunit S n=1 Tax=Ferrovum sp. TaxID=2609467 RepID=UPI00263161C7|nr:restriction endonuclease subunit S [Ferrovum sp.]
MSRIDELIAKHCPDGVEFRRLGECVVKNTGGGTPSRSIPSYWDGDIPWASVGDLSVPGNFILTTRASITSKGLKSSPSNIISRGDVIVAVKISPGKMKIAAKDIAINQDLRGLSLHNFINSSFLTYYFQTISIVGNGTIVKGITTDTLERIRVPIPPLEVQREIVKVLDTFTKLEAELEAELEARRRQYQYYRDALLAFRDQDVQWAAMADVGEFFRGRRFTKADYVEDGVGCIHYGEIYTHYGTSTNIVISHVQPEMKPILRFAKPGDVVVTDVGETVEDVGKAVAWMGADDVAIHDHCYAFRHSMNPKFVSYCMQTASFIAEKAKYVARTKINTLLMDGFSKIRIPVPPLEEQERIVSILDKFDALANDISIGLPAEIKARRQQYEHYRDRLLIFRETA